MPSCGQHNLDFLHQGDVMAKRFTDTEKWKRPWFRSLSVKQKLIWIYLCDDCDHAGIWYGDFDLMSYQLGFKVMEDDVLDLGKIEKYGNKYLLMSFFEFQYEHVKETFSAKVSAQNKIEKLKNDSSKIGHSPTVGGDSGESTSISIIKSIIKKGSMRGDENHSQLEEVYKLYPRKIGKTKGFAKLKVILKNKESLEKVKLAIHNYAEFCKNSGTEPKFIKHFDTFMNCWEDWINPEALKTYETTWAPGEGPWANGGVK